MSRANPDYSDEEEARGKAGRAVLGAYKDEILQGMAESLWILAYADWATENPEEAEQQLGVAGPGKDWADNAMANGLPKAAEKAAKDLYDLYEKANGNVVELYGLAQTADMEEDFSFYETEGPSERQRLDRQWKMSDALEFGQGFAAMALGHGIGWFDDHKAFEYEKVTFECNYDGDELTWSGGIDDVPEASKRIGRIIIVNDRSFYNHSFLLRFGTHYLLIGAGALDEALDEAIDWATENDPDLIITQQVNDEYRRLMLEAGGNPNDHDSRASERAMEEAAVDTYQGGNAGDYISSDTWFIVAENPSAENLRKFGREKNPAPDRFDIAGVTNPARPKVNPARQARELARRVIRNCGCKANPTIAELKNPKLVQAMLQEGLKDEFAQKVAAITLKPSPTGKMKTLEEFHRDLAANLAQGLMVEDDDYDE